ncbi:MAG: hypothetical protein Q4C71_03790 [Microbacteriaceae bacterium]|nr:hypothetical protein [Microbacteriaceae bacterium]
MNAEVKQGRFTRWQKIALEKPRHFIYLLIELLGSAGLFLWDFFRENSILAKHLSLWSVGVLIIVSYAVWWLYFSLRRNFSNRRINAGLVAGAFAIAAAVALAARLLIK